MQLLPLILLLGASMCVESKRGVWRDRRLFRDWIFRFKTSNYFDSPEQVCFLFI